MKKQKEHTKQPEEQAAQTDQIPGDQEAPAAEEQPPESTPDPLAAEVEQLRELVAQRDEKFLRLAAEYDNFRKRSAKEKESLWSDVKVDVAGAFLPVYDNLERALKQETADEAYKKGVEMTMTQLKAVLEKLGMTEINAQAQPFDPLLHNAVMHVEDENFGENTVCEVFQTGFTMGEKVVRFAMVKVAN